MASYLSNTKCTADIGLPKQKRMSESLIEKLISKIIYKYNKSLDL